MCLMTFAFITCLSCLGKGGNTPVIAVSVCVSVSDIVETCEETLGQFRAMFLATKPGICNMFSLKQSLQINNSEINNDK